MELPCPHCQNDSGSKVIDSRDGIDYRRRRRQCNKCKQRFTTYEIMEAEYQKIQAVSINVREFESVIASLRAIKEPRH